MIDSGRNEQKPKTGGKRGLYLSVYMLLFELVDLITSLESSLCIKRYKQVSLDEWIV